MSAGWFIAGLAVGAVGGYVVCEYIYADARAQRTAAQPRPLFGSSEPQAPTIPDTAVNIGAPMQAVRASELFAWFNNGSSVNLARNQ